LNLEEEDKVSEYYKHLDGWSNRIIQGDSLLVMTSLLEREGMAGKVQCIYIDPPYGIKYGSNWQIRINNRKVEDSNDDSLSGEPEQIKAFRDTWELGIHSYLSYLRDRILVSHQLLNSSGSCFIQISDENVHLVRNLLDEVYGSENFCALISFSKTSGLSNKLIPVTNDYIIWYCKNQADVKYNQLYRRKIFGGEGSKEYFNLELKTGEIRRMTETEMLKPESIPPGAKIFATDSIVSGGTTKPEEQKIHLKYQGKDFTLDCGPNRNWKGGFKGTKRLWEIGRLVRREGLRIYKRYFDDFPYIPYNNNWTDSRGETDMKYVVQTNREIIQRCILMTTDPGDLVLDPTCGSGTTAYVAEQWGRRWITIDTSRIAINVAKNRLLTANFPYYRLYDEQQGDLRQGFVYKKVPHVTLRSLANSEPADEETLFDQPEIDNKRMRVTGPFTVETLQSFDPVSPEELDNKFNQDERFEHRVLEHLKSAGIKNGIRNENAIFTRIDSLNSEYLHYAGYYNSAQGERMAYIHIGPKFGSVSKQAVSEAIKECRTRGHADWLIILGFSFESNINNENVTASMGSFEVTKVRMHDDLMQEGLLKKDKKAASFVTIGEPDIILEKTKDKKQVIVKIQGLDIYDPIKDEVKPRDIHDIAYWMIDDDYDGSNFVVKQVFFCGGDKDEFDKWKKGLSDLSESRSKRRQQLQSTLKIEIDEEAFDRLYGHESHPIDFKKGKKVAVRVISQFGEESTKVLTID
jgi:adenine-specific DNA-methyltransferase